MFDIGFWEIALIGIVGLVVIGPERLPAVARTLGSWVGKTRRFINQVKSDVSAEMKQEELRKALENDVGLDEIKQIMNTDHFSIEEEEESKPEYQVKAIEDEPDDDVTSKPKDDDPKA
jgi:sec-independent protein translocase protein TatB